MTRPSAPYCVACGGAQANHFSLWLDNLTDGISMRFPMHRMPLYAFLMRLSNVIVSIFGQLSFFAGRGIRAIALSSDPETAVSNRSKLLWQEALRRGIQMEQLMFFGSPSDAFRIRHAGRTEFFKSLPLSPEPSALRMDDKVIFKEALRAANLPVPSSFGVASLPAARKALSSVSVACVKPRTGSNGRHTYPNVRTEEELNHAFRKVREIAPFVTVEEYLEGNLCRATCVGGSMIGFLESAYPTIIGDGESTVGQLIEKANGQKPAGVDDMELDEVNEGFIRRRGYTRDSVLPSGMRLALTYRGGTGSGGSNREHGRAIHSSFIPTIEQAAKLTGLHIVGFDLIIPDPQLPADAQKWGFIEANSLPWIDLHATPYYGTPVDLSRDVWDLWLTKR